MNITLKDGSVKTVEAGITAADVAKELSMGLYKAACVCEVNGEICDLRTPLTEDDLLLVSSGRARKHRNCEEERNK